MSCLNGWNGLNGRCYQRFDTASINYEQAQAECKAKNASLAILSTLNKFALAKSIVLAGNGAIVILFFFYFFMSLNFKYIFLGRW